MAQALRQLNSDGTGLLEDGTEVQVVVARNGSLGVRPMRREDQTAGIDQVGGAPENFDTSGLDQPV